MSKATLGIDVAKHKIDVALLTEQNKMKHKVFLQSQKGFDELQAWLTRHGVHSIHACLEATGTYSEEIALFLYEKGHSVSVVNPARIHAYAKASLSRNKTDKVDATLIAQFCQSQNPELYSPPDPRIRELQMLSRHLDNLNESLQIQKNRLSSGIKSPPVIKSIHKVIDCLEKEIKETQKQINSLIDQDPTLKNDRELLKSIPGIGNLTASKLLAEIPDIKKYESVKQLVAFAGMNPQHYQSGSSVSKKSRLSKTGSARIRKLLFLPALVAKTHGEVFKSFEAKLLKNGKAKMIIVGAIMRKLLHIAYGVLKNNKSFDPKLAFQA